MAKRVRMGRMINGVVFGLSTPRRHGNSKSSNFMAEAGLPLSEPKKKGKGSTQITGKRPNLVIKDDIV